VVRSDHAIVAMAMGPWAGAGLPDCRIAGLPDCRIAGLPDCRITGKKEPGSNCLEPGIYLATTYSHKTYRLTTIGAAAFHFRVRNGTGWFHHALVTRGQL
jgi:hypothetical protein